MINTYTHKEKEWTYQANNSGYFDWGSPGIDPLLKHKI